jgi:AcrR family transcriptional regulator
MDKTPPRQLIIEAVVTCIEKYGIDKLTTRKIAEAAGMNIASINYYFRSKDELVAETLTTTVNHMMEDVFAAIDDAGKSFEEALKDVFFYLIDGATRFPGISTAHLYGAVVEKRYDSPGGQAIGRVFERLVERAMKELPLKDPGEIRFQMAQVVSAIIFSMLAPGFFPVPEKVQPLDAEHCRRMAGAYAGTFFAAV